MHGLATFEVQGSQDPGQGQRGGGDFAISYSGEGFLLELAKLEGRLVVAAAWDVG